MKGIIENEKEGSFETVILLFGRSMKLVYYEGKKLTSTGV